MRESPVQFCAPALAASAISNAERRPLGVAALDAALGGGLSVSRLHEFYAAGDADAASLVGFGALCAARCAAAAGPIVWIAERSRALELYPPGLSELGIDPGRLLFVSVADERALLRMAAEIVRSPAAGTAVIAPARIPKRVDLTASRRLALAAERSGVTAILLRGAGMQQPSAAATRWVVAAAPSRPLDPDAPGPPAFAVDLVRQRGRPPSPGWRMEWDRDAGRFAGAPLSRPLSAEPGERRLAG